MKTNRPLRHIWLTCVAVAFLVSAAPSFAASAMPSAPDSSANLYLNFKNAPLESVLNYLSEAAGFIIHLKTEVKGKVTVYSGYPVSLQEALDLLDEALDAQGYTAVRNGRTLTIGPKQDAWRQNLPVRVGSKPERIPADDQIVTQIIPISYLSAPQLIRDLQPLLPQEASLWANEASNALVLTDTQRHIHRMTEIIRALDTSVANVLSLRVFPLRYADAKALASVLKDLFAPSDSRQSGSSAQSAPLLPAPADEPGGPGQGQVLGSAPSQTTASTRTTIARNVGTVAVAEERSNALVVRAAEPVMKTVEMLVQQLDLDVQGVTELRVFHLRSADPQETADLLSSLFGDASSTGSSGNRGFTQFGGGPVGFGGPGGSGGAGGFGGPSGGGGSSGAGGMTPAALGEQGSRVSKESKVVAVADARSSSIVISASRVLMAEVAKIIADLDSSSAKKQEVFVFKMEHGDVDAVQQLLEGLFPTPTTSSGSTRSSSRQQNRAGAQLSNRATQSQNGSGTGSAGTSLGRATGGLGGSSSGQGQ